MSKQPKIQLPVSGGYWQIHAHLPNTTKLQYDAALHLGGEIVCNVFCHDYVELITDSLILDSAHIALATESDYALVAQFLAATEAYVSGATA